MAAPVFDIAAFKERVLDCETEMMACRELEKGVALLTKEDAFNFDSRWKMRRTVAGIIHALLSKYRIGLMWSLIKTIISLRVPDICEIMHQYRARCKNQILQIYNHIWMFDVAIGLLEHHSAAVVWENLHPCLPLGYIVAVETCHGEKKWSLATHAVDLVADFRKKFVDFLPSDDEMLTHDLCHHTCTFGFFKYEFEMAAFMDRYNGVLRAKAVHHDGRKAKTISITKTINDTVIFRSVQELADDNIVTIFY